jgi:hypothetical protein
MTTTQSLVIASLDCSCSGDDDLAEAVEGMAGDVRQRIEIIGVEVIDVCFVGRIDVCEGGVAVRHARCTLIMVGSRFKTSESATEHCADHVDVSISRGCHSVHVTRSSIIFPSLGRRVGLGKRFFEPEALGV